MYAWYTVQYSISVRYYSLHYYSNLLRAQVFDLTGKLTISMHRKKVYDLRVTQVYDLSKQTL